MTQQNRLYHIQSPNVSTRPSHSISLLSDSYTVYYSFRLGDHIDGPHLEYLIGGDAYNIDIVSISSYTTLYRSLRMWRPKGNRLPKRRV